MANLGLYPSQAVVNLEVGTPTLFNNWLITLQSWSTTIDRTNMTSGAGIDATNLTPSTVPAATFGGTAGYTFLAPATSVVPLTVSAIAGQTADIQDWTLTSGGTKAMFLAANGALSIASNGNLFLGMSSTMSSGFLNFASGSGFSTIQTTSTSAGSTGVVGSIFAVFPSGVGTPSLAQTSVNGNVGISGTTYANSSSRKIKRDIQPLVFDGLELLKKALPQSWRHIDDPEDAPLSAGPIAEELDEPIRIGEAGVAITPYLAALHHAILKLAEHAGI